MQIIPVLDLMGGVVVRGVGGRRSEYRPIESRLCHRSDPVSIAQAYRELGLEELYVADLDAIGGAPPAWRTFDQLAAAGMRLWIDAGTGDASRAGAMQSYAERQPALAGVIVGLESVAGPAELAAIAQSVTRERLIFSLDLRLGRPLATADWKEVDALEIARSAVECGIERIILLDLAQVGIEGGPGTLQLCEQLLARFPQVRLVGGGGVRGPADLRALESAGCTAALVASALHDGRLTAADCRQAMA